MTDRHFLRFAPHLSVSADLRRLIEFRWQVQRRLARMQNLYRKTKPPQESSIEMKEDLEAGRLNEKEQHVSKSAATNQETACIELPSMGPQGVAPPMVLEV